MSGTGFREISRRSFLRSTAGVGIIGGTGIGTQSVYGQTASNSDWSMWGGGPTRTNYSEATIPTEGFGIKWRSEVSSDIYSSPVISNDTIYFGGLDKTVYALDRESESIKWRFETGGRITSSPAMAGETLYVSCWDGLLYSINSATGELRWKKSDFDQDWPHPFSINSSPAIENGSVYISNMEGNLHSVDANSGELQWSFDFSWQFDGLDTSMSPAVSNGVVLITSAYDGDKYGTVHALDSHTGDLKWRYETEGEEPTIPVISDGTVYVGNEKSVYALNIESGQLRWKTQINGGGAIASPASDGNTIYVPGRFDGNLFALEPESGDIQWKYQTGFLTTSPTVVDNTIFIGGTENIHAIDADTGNEVTRVQDKSDRKTTPAVSGDSIVLGSSQSVISLSEGVSESSGSDSATSTPTSSSEDGTPQTTSTQGPIEASDSNGGDGSLFDAVATIGSYVVQAAFFILLLLLGIGFLDGLIGGSSTSESNTTHRSGQRTNKSKSNLRDKDNNDGISSSSESTGVRTNEYGELIEEDRE